MHLDGLVAHGKLGIIAATVMLGARKIANAYS